MSWCDKLASVPTVGIWLDWHFTPSNAIFDALSEPLLNRLVENERQKFTISRQEAFQITINTEDGFEYAIEPSKISVGFRHNLRARSQSGGPPVMELLSRPMPYSQLLPEISDRVVETCSFITKIKHRRMHRIGIVSTTTVDPEEAPPGIRRFIAYLGRPWTKGLDNFAVQVAAVINEGTGFVDRCFHTLVQPEDKRELLTVAFDWQRKFDVGQPVGPEMLRRSLEKAEYDAMNYFEDLGEGSRFDENVIRASA